MSDWRPAVADDPPGYAEILASLATDIERGLLEPGDRLPTHRGLAESLGVSLGTVTRAYAEARRRGLVQGEVGRGTFVSDRSRGDTRWGLDAVTDRSVVDLSLLIAPPVEGPGVAPILREGLLDAVEALDLDRTLGYQPHAGAAGHRRAGAAWIRRTSFEVDPSEVLVCASAQHAMTCAASVVARPGDLVLTEALTAPGFKDVAAWMQLRLHGLPMDEDGLIPSAFEEACREGGARVLYTMPVLHNPTAATAPVERRAEIASIARRHGVAILEDGVQGLLPADGIAPLSSFAPESSYYITSLSKTVAAGLRVGFLRAPPGAVSQLEDAVRATMWMTSPLLAEIAARWIEDGTAERILAERRREARARQAIAREILEGQAFSADPGGYQVWLDPHPWDPDALVRAARARGVTITPASVFVAGRGHPPSRTRLCLSAARDRDRLREGLETVRALLEAGPSGP